MTSTETILWKLNKRTGYWEYQRTCDVGTAQEWLRVFQADEPNETFKLSKNKPKPPKSKLDRK